MIKKYMLIFCLFVAASSLFADAQKGFSLLAEGKYRYAIDYLEQVGNKDGAVWRAMGDAELELGNKGKARVYWRRAEPLLGFWGRHMVRQKVLSLDHHIADEWQIVGAPAMVNQVLSFFLALPVLFFQLLFLIVLGLLAYSLSYFATERAVRWRDVVIALLFFLVLAVLVQKYRSMRLGTAVFISSRVALRSGPGDGFAQMQDCCEGSEALVLDERGDFAKVVSGQQIRGWVKKDGFIKI